MSHEIDIILHESKIIVFYRRDFLCEAFIPDLGKYLNESNRREFIDYFEEHSLFEIASTDLIVRIFNMWLRSKE